MLAEVLLLGALCDETYRFAARDAVLRAEAAIEECLELNDQLWAAHVTAGALHCCRFAWSKADRAFATHLPWHLPKPARTSGMRRSCLPWEEPRKRRIALRGA